MKKLERLRKNLFAAIDEPNLKKVKRYVKKARYINKEKEIINGKKDGIAPIHLAVYRGSLEIVQFLLKIMLILMLLVMDVLFLTRTLLT